MEMIQKSGVFLSADGKTELPYTLCLPQDKKPSAILQITHGMCEYFERYRPMTEYFVSRGFAVCGYDQLGHGKRAIDAGTNGYFAKKAGHEILPEDVYRMSRAVRAELPDLPLFLFGHSLGSIVIRNTAAKYGREYAGVIFMGTNGRNPMIHAAIALASAMKLFRGEWYRSAFLRNAGFLGYNKRWPEENMPNSWISSDPDHRINALKDPLGGYKFTLSANLDLYRMMRAINSPKWAKKLPKHLPVLLISGEHDPLGGDGAGIRELGTWLEKAGIKDVSVVLIKKGRHEILNDFCAGETLEAMFNFLGRYIPI